MENKANDYSDWQGQLQLANKDLAEHDARIEVNDCEFVYAVDIIVGDERTNFAENYYEDELSESISDAWVHALTLVRMKEEKERQAQFLRDELLIFRKVHGWTHGDPALIYGCTEIPVFFHNAESNEVVSVDNKPGGIDHFENMNGEFYVLFDDYDEAYRQLEEHDKENN